MGDKGYSPTLPDSDSVLIRPTKEIKMMNFDVVEPVLSSE